MGSSSVESSGFKSTSASGFDAKEVSSFLQAGNTQASRTGNITSPTQRTKTSAAGEPLGPTGFSSEFTSQGQLDLLVNTFLRRRQSIDQKRAQPSRTGLFLGGRS